MTTTTLTLQVPNVRDHRQVRNGIAGLTAFGISCAGTVHFLSQGKYKEAFGAGSLSLIALVITVDSLISETKATQNVPSQDQKNKEQDLATLCEALEETTACLSANDGIDTLQTKEFKDQHITKVWGKFQSALQHQRPQLANSTSTFQVVTLQASQTLSPMSKANNLLAQLEKQRQKQT